MDFAIGDTVMVNLHAHKQETGIVVHMTKDDILFIKSISKRMRVMGKDVAECIEIIKKEKDRKETNGLSSCQIQSFVNELTDSNGTNYELIGDKYETGCDGFPIDFDKAMCWYKSGHKLGNIRCTVELARIFSNYYENYDEAEKYWKVGIDLGYHYCAYAANVMYRTVPNGKQKELYYIRKYLQLTNDTDVGALLDFAVCQLTMDVPDYSEAYKYLMIAYNLNRNSIGVQQFLAITVYRGLGCIKDVNKAIEMHKKLALDEHSECSMLWMSVYNARNETLDIVNNIHPLRHEIYNSFMNVIANGDSHELYYGNWIKINEYHAFEKKDIMSSCLIISLKIFGILQCAINVKDVKKCVENMFGLNKQNELHCVEDLWMKSWLWFFTERYIIIKSLFELPNGLIDMITEFELSILVSNDK